MMKHTFLKTMVLVLTLLGGVNVAWADDVVETVTATMDGWARMDNSAVNYDVAASSHIEIKYETDKNFYGLLCFEIPAKSGYKVKSAVLRLVSKKISGNRQTNFYKLSTDISSKPAFANLAISDALASTAIGTVKAEGESGKQISSDAISADKYKTIDLWQNSITLDAAKVVAGEKLNILFATSTTDQTSNNNNSNRFFGKNAEGFTNDNISLTCAATDLVPQLTVTYEEDSDVKTDVITPLVDTYLRKGNTADHGSETTMELKTYADGDADFVGYMSFEYSVPTGMELQSAKLRVVSAQIKGDRTLNFYSFANDVAGNAKYADYADAITAAKATTAVGTVSLEGQSGKSVVSDDITTEKYQTITAWQNTVDLTDFVKTQTGNFGLLMARVDADISNKIFTSDATGISNSNCTYFNSCTASDLVPQLTLVFKKSEGGSDPTTPTTDGDYTITINDSEHGTVTADHTKANENETVTLTVTPTSDSYKLVNLVIEQVTDDEGDTPSMAPRRTSPSFVGYVEWTKVNATTYTFTMPANNVVISATFTDNPVARPTITYDEPNNKVTLHLTTQPTGDEEGFAVNTRLYYTTDNTDPKTSTTRQEATADVDIDVTADITIIRVVGVSSDGHTSVEVNQVVSLVRYLTVSKEWTAFCSPETFAVPEGLKVYTITAVTQPTDASEAGSVTLKEQTVIAEGVPMVIENAGYANATRFRIENTTGSIEAADKCSEFKGSATAASTLSSNTSNYVLKNGVFIRTTATKVSKFGCYLEFAASTSAPRFSIVIDNNVTAIKTLGVATLDEGAWYNLNGVRMAQPTQKGIYIHQGKKVVIK